MTQHTPQDSQSELRDAILANLKHAYFNAKTDTIALENGLIPNHNHALGILENKTDDLMQIINTQKQAHASIVIGEDEKTSGYGKHDGEYEYHTTRNQLRAEQRERNIL